MLSCREIAKAQRIGHERTNKYRECTQWYQPCAKFCTNSEEIYVGTIFIDRYSIFPLKLTYRINRELMSRTKITVR